MAHVPDLILLSGHAQLPKNAAAKTVFDILTITVTIQSVDWTITNAETTLITPAAQGFVRKCLIGACVLDPVEDVVAVIEDRYMAGAKKTVIAALRELYRSAGETHRGMQEEPPRA